jgi:hypothetical protein
MDRIRQSEEYQTTMSFNREKEVNKSIETREKVAVEREKIAAQREIAANQLAIAKENKNKYDMPNKNKSNSKKPKK